MKVKFLLIFICSVTGITAQYHDNADGRPYKMKYSGAPYIDTVQALSVQTIPGKVECEFYDIGGDSISYFDSDKSNNGSGNLNKGIGYLNNFRKDEAPDISFTKYHDSIDNSPYSIVQPEIDKMYLGWTEPGEWTRYSVDVKESGTYQIGTMYTSNRGGAIQIIIDDSDTTALLNITSTYDAKEPIAWRQWHHWNKADSLTSLHINAGRRIVTLKIVQQGNFNFDYLLFTKIK